MKNRNAKRGAWSLGTLLAFCALGLAACGGSSPSTPTVTPPAGEAGGSAPAPALASSLAPSLAISAYSSVPRAGTLAPGEAETVVAYLDGVPVTLGQLDRFGRRFLRSAHSGMMKAGKDPLSYLPAYTRYFAVVRQAYKEGIEKTPEVKAQVRLHRVVPLSAPYRKALIANAKIPAEAVKSGIPKQWTRINFRLYIFDTMENAQVARGKLKAPDYAPPEDTPGFTYVAGKSAPETGEVFLGSGFFDEFDDPYLFTLKEGELSRPVQSGLGPALAVVISRHDLSSQEQSDFVAGMRANLSDQYGRQQAKKEAGAFPVVILPDNLQAVLQEKVPSPAYATTAPIARVGDLRVTMGSFLKEANVNLGFLTQQYAPNQWFTQIQNELKLFCEEVALGMAADKAGFGKNTTATAARDEKEYEEGLVFAAWERKVWRTAQVTVTPEEEKAAYEAEKGRFVVSEAATVQYYFTPLKEDLEAMSKRSQEGIPFDKLALGLERKKGATMGKPLEVKERRILKGSTDLQPLQEAIFAMEAGATQILEVDMGYYLVHVLDREKGRQLPQVDVKGYLVNSITSRKKNDALLAQEEQLYKAVKVTMAGEGLPHKGVPASGAGDRG